MDLNNDCGETVNLSRPDALDMVFLGRFTANRRSFIHMPQGMRVPMYCGATGRAYLATLPLAMIVTGIVGVLIGVPTLRLRGDYLAIVTLGFGEIIRLLATIIPALKGNTGFQSIGRPPGTDDKGVPIFVQSNGTAWYWLILTVIIVVMLLLGNLERSRVGRAWIAIREDEDAAEVMGVNAFKFKLWAFTIGAAIGGLSGALYAGQVQYVAPPTFNIINSMLFLCAVVLGGQGNKLGVILGAFIIVYLPARVQGIEVGGQSLSEFKYLFFGIALVVLMIFRPQGLFPARARLLTFGRKVYAAVRRNPDPLPSGSEEAHA